MSEKELREKIARKLYETSPLYSDFERQTWEQLCFEDDETCVDEVVLTRRREADSILSLLREEGVDLEGWRPIEGETKNGPMLRWHKLWNVPIAVERNQWPNEIQMPWVEATKTTQWPEEAFLPFCRPLPAPPLSALENPA